MLMVVVDIESLSQRVVAEALEATMKTSTYSESMV